MTKSDTASTVVLDKPSVRKHLHIKLTRKHVILPHADVRIAFDPIDRVSITSNAIG